MLKASDLLTLVFSIELIGRKGSNFCLIEFLYNLKHEAGKPGQAKLYDDIFL